MNDHESLNQAMVQHMQAALDAQAASAELAQWRQQVTVEGWSRDTRVRVTIDGSGLIVQARCARPDFDSGAGASQAFTEALQDARAKHAKLASDKLAAAKVPLGTDAVMDAADAYLENLIDAFDSID
ncbi:MAG: hypothetical protein FWF75_04860 [Propionibacteriaceae bacterium]|nr:hypothetical protein [Propionibacteriaceae bacterium]